MKCEGAVQGLVELTTSPRLIITAHPSPPVTQTAIFSDSIHRYSQFHVQHMPRAATTLKLWLEITRTGETLSRWKHGIQCALTISSRYATPP